MKHALTLLCLLFGLTITSIAQSKVKASDIIKQINEGREVTYTNIEVEGNLDLTDLQNRPRKENRSPPYAAMPRVRTRGRHGLTARTTVKQRWKQVLKGITGHV